MVVVLIITMVLMPVTVVKVVVVVVHPQTRLTVERKVKVMRRG